MEAIFEHLREHAALHFSLGLVELPFYNLPDGSRMVAPRVLSRTSVVVRRVVELPKGMSLEAQEEEDAAEFDPRKRAAEEEHRAFWSEFLEDLTLDDPEQPIPPPARQRHMYIMMPAPSGSSWITIYHSFPTGPVGLLLSYQKDTLGERASEAIIDRWEDVRPQIGEGARVVERRGRRRIADEFPLVEGAEGRRMALEWLRRRTNDFVNVLRPAVRAAVAEAESLDD